MDSRFARVGQIAGTHLRHVLRELGRLDEAEPYYREALDGYRRTLGPDHDTTLRQMNRLAALHVAQERLDLAEESPATALAKLREHEEASPLLLQLEKWLHAPQPESPQDLDALLAPYAAPERA